MSRPDHPLLYEINTRVCLTELSRSLGRPATLDDIPDADLDHLALLGFEWVWLLGVWQLGTAAQQVSRENPQWRREFEETLPDLRDEDIAGSMFAVQSYEASNELGGAEALARIRARLHRRGMRLMLDFVPNHVAPDHPWVNRHPEFFISGSDDDLTREPQNYCRLPSLLGRVLAHGRDPYFPGWPDTLQLNYGNPQLQEAMTGELLRIAEQCDGVRCDMAMLVLPEVFERTWKIKAEPFWPQAIPAVRRRHSDFVFMAEVYWDMEWTLQQQGFDYTYDKRLYDRLRDRHARPVHDHLLAGIDFQQKLARFLENHDEPRVAATFPFDVHQAAAVVTYFTPGLRLFHQGQFEGRVKHVSPHLRRGPDEPVSPCVQQLYNRLLKALHKPVARRGKWRLLECVPAWEGNGSCDDFLAFVWQTDGGGERLLAAVNYAPHPGQCFVRLPFADLCGRQFRLYDLLGDACYIRDGCDLEARGLYLDVPAWQAHVFSMTSCNG